MLPDFFRVQKLGRLEEAVAASFDPLEGEARRARILQYLRDPGAGQSYLRGKVLTGMELSIGELAQ
jgi:hypothetical protein